MAGPLTLSSWPGTAGDPSISYFDHFLEQMQFGLPGGYGVLPSRADDILGSYTNEFKVTADSSGMQVKVSQGRVTAKGVFAKVPDASVTGGVYALTVTSAHATLYRIDTVIVRFDLTNGTATLRMLDGTAAVVASAQPTALTQSATTWDVPLAYVFVDPTVTTISVKDVADCRVFCPTVPELARIAGFENPIIDGGMTYWPDGVTFTSIANGTYGPSMFVYGKTSAVVHDLLRSADAPAVAANVQKDSYSLHLDVTTADASIAAGDQCTIAQKVEGYRAQRILQRGFTLPFWVKDSVIGPHAVAFINAGGDRSCVCEYIIHQADTWELKFVHVPASPTAGTWDYTTGHGLQIFWTQVAGTTYHATTPGAWETGAFYGTARTVNGVSSTSNNFKLWGVGPMVPGGLVLPFSPRDDEETLVRRYYEVFGGDVTNQELGIGLASSNTACQTTLRFAPKRAIPTMASATAATDFSFTNGSGSPQAGSGGPTFANTSKTSTVVLLTTGAALTTGQAGRLITANTNARITANARL